MKTLVIGGTGTVGSNVVRELLSREVQAVVLTRSFEKAKGLPLGARGVIGDVLDPGIVRTMFKGVDSVFMLTPVSATETHEGLMAINGARMAGIKRFVYMSVHRLDEALHLPHFGSKAPIEAVLKSSGMAYTILRPNNFYQNDYRFKDHLLQNGVYPQPIGDIGVSRVDVRDIAEAAGVVLTQSGHEGRTYNLVGPEAHTGKSTAGIWSRALGKTVTYAGNDLDAWEKEWLQYLPAWMVFDFRLMYEFFQKNGFKASSADLARQERLLGRPPRSFEKFAEETASMWQNVWEMGRAA